VNEHITLGELEQILTGRISSERMRFAVSHLIRGCEACRAAAREWWGPPERTSPLAYDTALDRALDFLERLQRLPRHEQPRFRRALALLASGEGVLAVAGAMRVGRLGVYEAFLARSWAVRYDRPWEMLHCAKVATVMAEGFNPRIYGGRKVADYRARAWGELANALRVVNELGRAEEAFGRAFSLLEAGTGDPLLKARLLDLEASLLGTEREFDLALERLAILPDLYREAGAPHLASRAVINRALYTFYSGDVEEALRINTEGFALIEKERDPQLLVTATHNQLLFLVEQGRHPEANRVLFDNRPAIHRTGQIATLRLRWIEGRINYGLERFASAEEAFREVKEGFTDEKLRFSRALTGLDLAMALMQQGRMEEAEREVLESAATFRALSIHREILGCVILLEEAFRKSTVTLRLLEGTVRRIRRKQVELGL
jgi:tetratricopeptide (TPR) repeat protein